MDIRQLMQRAYDLAWRLSPDPSTRNGALLISHGAVIAEGVNRFPWGISDDHRWSDRDQKYPLVVHAEQAAIIEAARRGIRTVGSIIICPWAACRQCAKFITHAGISEVIAHKAAYDRSHGQWVEEIEQARKWFAEAGVRYTLWDSEVGGVQALANGQVWQP